MTMADPHRGKRCWCIKCDSEVFFRDEWMCRHCDPVERINALAEKYAKVRDDIAPLWVEFMNYGKKTSFIKCADIILESE